MSEDSISFSFPAIELVQPIGTFFVAALPSKRLSDNTWFDVRRMLKEESDIEAYLGIQRPLSPKRVEEISQYVRTVDACFPTAVVLAIPGTCVFYDTEKKIMTLSNHLECEDPEEQVLYRQIAKVLDGQHRIEGLKGYDGPEFQVNISIFVDVDVAEQAYIFSTVNLAQTKVNKSLVYDLYDLARARSPQRVCHNIAVALDSNEGGPFHRRIKRLGVTTQGRFNETITQATFVQAVIRYICVDEIQQLRDRDEYKRGRIPERVSADQLKKLIFRKRLIPLVPVVSTCCR